MRTYGDVRIVSTTINPVSLQVVMFMDVWQMPMFFFLSGVFFNIFYFKISKDICPPIHIFLSAKIKVGACLHFLAFLETPPKYLNCFAYFWLNF